MHSLFNTSFIDAMDFNHHFDTVDFNLSFDTVDFNAPFDTMDFNHPLHLINNFISYDSIICNASYITYHLMSQHP
jgi:hypothetical protein